MEATAGDPKTGDKGSGGKPPGAAAMEATAGDPKTGGKPPGAAAMEATAGDPKTGDKGSGGKTPVAAAMEGTAGDPKTGVSGDKGSGDPKTAEPSDKGSGDQKNAQPCDEKTANDGSQSHQKRGVDGSGCDDKQVSAESLSRGSGDKRVPPGSHLAHEAGAGRSGSDDKKPGSGSRSGETEAAPRSRLSANAAEFIPAQVAPSPPLGGTGYFHPPRAPPFTPPPQHPSAPGLYPWVRAPSVTPPAPRVDPTGGFWTPSPRQTPLLGTPSPTQTPPSSIGSTGGFRTPSPTQTPLLGTPSPKQTPTSSIGSRSSSGSSSGPQPTQPHQPKIQGYSAVTRLGRKAALELEMEKRKEQMLHYLNSADHDYSAQAANLGRKLVVSFEDLLQNNRELAIQICQDRGTNSTWLNEACEMFFQSKQLPSNKVTFEFENIPSRLWEAIDFMQSKDCTEGRYICSNTSYVETATDHGREVTNLVINRILDDVGDKGLSWDGKLGLADLLFGETMDGDRKLYIAKRPVYKSPQASQPRLRDIKSIWTIVKDGCKLRENKLPLYFLELKNDLENATHTSDWFIQYLRFHPALYASSPRRYFVTSIQMVTRRMRLLADSIYSSLFTVHPLPNQEDWRSLANDGPLYKLLTFKFQGSQPNNQDPNNQNSKQTSSYANHYASLLDYVKNGLSHLAQYIVVMDDDEIELFLAQTFPKMLPDIMKGILLRGGMHDKFAACWKAYCKTK